MLTRCGFVPATYQVPVPPLELGADQPSFSAFLLQQTTALANKICSPLRASGEGSNSNARAPHGCSSLLACGGEPAASALKRPARDHDVPQPASGGEVAPTAALGGTATLSPPTSPPRARLKLTPAVHPPLPSVAGASRSSHVAAEHQERVPWSRRRSELDDLQIPGDKIGRPAHSSPPSSRRKKGPPPASTLFGDGVADGSAIDGGF
jgi:hypothetical protein